MYRLYVRLSGDNFDCGDFHERHGHDLGGRIHVTKRKRDDVVQDVGCLWHSESQELGSSAEIDEKIIELANRIKGPLEAYCATRGRPDICMILVWYYAHHEGPRGVFLSAESIQVLAQLNAGFDYDLSRKLNQKGASKR